MTIESIFEIGMVKAHGKASLLPLLVLFLIAPAFDRAISAQEQEAKPKSGHYFVATNGNDAWNGTLPVPNSNRTNGPFASLAGAREAIRRLKGGETGTIGPGGITVWVRGGVYPLSETFTLGAIDSGTPDAPVVYRAYGNEAVVLTGGRRITGFNTYKGQILKADVGAQGFKDVYFRQLFLNGKRQILARYPNFDPNDLNGGWAYSAADSDRRTLQVRPQDFRKWEHHEAGQVVIFPHYNWWNNILGIVSIDLNRRIMTLTSDASYDITAGDRYFFRNLLEELDSPGEWYLDRATGTLYFWPPTDLKSGAVYAPVLETLVEIDGAANITLRGFTIECGEGSAVIVRDSTDCLIAQNIIRNVGGYADGKVAAVVVDGGRHNGVAGNDIYEVGNSAIILRGGERKTLGPAGNYADNNYIHHVGVLYKQGVGVDLSGVGNRASHNLIHDCPRFGIMFDGNDQIIEYNHIHHVSLETSDTGAIYVDGRDWLTPRGSVIRYNFIHDVLGYGRENGEWVSPYFAWGIYLDDNANGVDVIGNVVARAIRGLVHLQNGRDNVAENNIFVDGGSQQVEMNGWPKTSAQYIETLPRMIKGYEEYGSLPAWSKYRGLRGSSPQDAVPMGNNKLQRNIFYYQEPKAKLYKHVNLPKDSFECDYNLVYHFGLPLLTDIENVNAEQQWAQWQALGFDRHSLVANPLFVDPQKDDYRLRPDSPALKLGFKPIPVEKIGPYRDSLRATWPIVEATGVRPAARRHSVSDH